MIEVFATAGISNLCRPIVSLDVLGLLVAGGYAAWPQQGLDALLDQAPPRAETAAGAATKARAKAAIPSAAETRASVANIKDIFKEELSGATTPEKRAALARQLLAQAEKTSERSDGWALFSEAMRLASDAGDVALSLDAVSAASRQFAIDADGMKLEAITKLGAKAAGETVNSLAMSALAIARKAADSGASPTAQKAISLASAFAKKAKNKSLFAEVTKFQQVMRDKEKNEKESAAVKARLDASPNDPDACLEAGKFFCFKVNDWEKGLPLLAKGSDKELARLATADLNAGRNSVSAVSVADAWWEWSEAEKPPRKTAGFSRAASLYETAVAHTQGLERARIEKRIRQAISETGDIGKKIYLADLKENKVTGLNMPLTKDGTYQGKAFKCGNRPWPKGIVAMPAREAILAYAEPPNAKKISGGAGVITPLNHTGQPSSPLVFEIDGDGRKAWSSEPLTKRDEMVSFDIALSGAKEIVLITKCGWSSSAWPAWLDPAITY